MIDRFTRIDKLRMYAHKVLPLVYDDSLSYYEYLCKVVQKVNEVIENDGEQSTTIEEFGQVLEDTLEEMDAKMDSMQEQVDEAVENAETATENAIQAKEDADDAAEAANTAAEHAEATAVKYGTPYAVNSASGMTDHDYIYVYTGTTGGGYTQGNWYYWNGTAWTSGGVYVGDISDAVLFNTSQSKTEAEKAQARENAGAVSQDDFDVVDSQFNYGNHYLLLDAWSDVNKYINTNGEEATTGYTAYTSVEITEDYIGKTLYVTGCAFYGAVRPYVFVANDTTIEYPSTTEPTVPTQVNDVVFNVTKTGTLYVNVYYGTTANNRQIGCVYYKDIESIKAKDLPTDAISYKPIGLGTLINKKLLRAQNGAISDIDNTLYLISDYVQIKPNTYYLVTSCQFYGQGLFAWYDDNQNYISGVASADGGTVTYLHNYKVKSPSNAKYIVIGYKQESSIVPFLLEGNMTSVEFSKRWYGKKWTGLGDSLTEENLRSMTHYFDYIVAATGITFVNKGSSGTGYAKGTDNFRVTSQTVSSDTDVTTIFGSGNDASSGLSLGTATDTGTSTIAGCINTTIDNLRSINPIMQIGIITPTPWVNNTPEDAGWMENYSQLILAICKLRGVPCLDLYHCSNLDPNESSVRAAAYSRDEGGGVHPDEAGHALIAPRIQAFLDTLLMH